MSEKSDWELEERVERLFEEVVFPVFDDITAQYDGIGGYAVRTVPDSPLITGISRYASIMVRHPGGMEMVVCVYWVDGSLRLVAENIRMVTLSKTFDIFTVTRETLGKQIKFLSGLEW